MVIIDTREFAFSCGAKSYFRIAYLSGRPERALSLCHHAHESRLSAAECEVAREKAAQLWTEEDFERAWQTW